MKENTADRYAYLEAIWKSTPYKVGTLSGVAYVRRGKLEELACSYSIEQLEALQRYIVLGVNGGIIKDRRVAKAIHSIVGQILKQMKEEVIVES